MFESIVMLLAMQSLPGQDLAAPTAPHATLSASRPATRHPSVADITRDRVPPTMLVADYDVPTPRDRAFEREEPSVSDEEPHADPARQWGWLFEHRSRHHGPAIPRFDHDARHVF